MLIYIVVNGGAYDAPSYAMFQSKQKAIELALSWSEEAIWDDGDWVDLIECNVETQAMRRIEQAEIVNE